MAGSLTDDKSFYKTQQWRKIRAAVLKRDKYTDQWRRRFGIMEPAETVHHVFLLQDHPELKLDPRNLVSVSRHTHAYILHKPDGSLTEAGKSLQEIIKKRYPGII